MDDLEDRELVSRVLTGDRTAFAVLYDRHARLVRAVGYGACHDYDVANDLCQETFLTGFQKLDQLREPEKVGAWLVGIARQVGREWRRSRSRDRHRYGKPPEQIGHDGEMLDESEALLRQMAELPEDEQLALHLYYLEEQPANQARSILGLSRSGFYRVLDRARKRLSRALEILKGGEAS